MTLAEQVAALQKTVAALQAQNRQHSNVLDRMGREVHLHERQLRPVRNAPLINRRDADSLYGPETMRRQLGSRGTAPLNLTGLRGLVGESQPANIPEVKTLPEIGDRSVHPGTVLQSGGIVYRRAPFGWEAISAISPSMGAPVSSSPFGSGTGHQPVSINAGMIQAGTFEARPVWVTEGTIYIETSRSTIASIAPKPIYQFVTGAWVYIAGMFYRSQAELAALAGTLLASDAGVVVYVESPFCHRLKWTGAAWDWADPGDRSGQYSYWPVDVPDGWHIVDGSVVDRLNGDGSTSVITLADTVTNPLYLKTGAAWTGVINNAVNPTIGSIAASATSAVNVTSLAGTTVAASGHTHPAPAASLAGGDPVRNLTSPLYYRL